LLQPRATWYRNPSRSGYNIPLISVGPTRNFYPDFLVWKDEDVFAVDTTGGHLLKDKTGRKLLSIEPAKGAAGRLIVRLVSAGKWNATVEQEDSAGFTVWGRKQDNTLRAIHVDSVKDAVDRSVTRDPL
jgi:type III restriction enzyme